MSSINWASPPSADVVADALTGVPLTLQDYLTTWSRLHGVRPRGLVAFWLHWMYRLARPLARAGAPPALVSISGAGLAMLGAAAAASAIPGRLVWAALAIALAGLADGMDGAVAVLQRRDGPAGAIVDAVCDRITDLILVLTLWLAGAPGIVCCVIGAIFLLHEYIRAMARSMGLRDDTIITVAERPTRVIVVIAFLLAGGTAGSWLGSAQAFWPAAGAWCALGVSMIGLAQLTVWLLRSLYSRPDG